MEKRVVTQNRGENLFKISGTDKLIIYKIEVQPLWNNKIKIGSARNLEDALSIIKSYSGSQIKGISEW